MFFFYCPMCLVPTGNKETDEAEVEEQEEEEEAEEEVKPVKKNAKKQVEEEEEVEDKREHVNIIFIGHVGKSFNIIMINYFSCMFRVAY